MSKLGNHLTRAAGSADDGFDLDELKGRARTRQVRRRAAAGSMAAVLLLGVGSIAWAASQPDAAPRQQLTAGDDTSTTDPATTVPETTAAPSTSTTDLATTTVVPTTEAPTTTTAVESTTTTPPPVTTTTLDPGVPMDDFYEIDGAYTGNEQYRIGGRCASTSHELTATYSPRGQAFDGNWVGGPWSYRASYCGSTEGDTWHGEGSGTLTSPDGATTLTLKISHDAPVGTTGVPYSTDVTGGTGAFAGATGECRFTITITNQSFGSQDQAGDIDCFLFPEHAGDPTTTTRPAAEFG